MQLHLIRHPRPDVAEGICYGRTDLGLAESAAECARRLAPQLPADIPLYSSPLRRCRELAEALHPTPIFDDRLVEMNFGAWEMRPWAELRRTEMDQWIADLLGFCPPGGESAGMLHDRVADFVRERQREGCEAVALITHSGVMKVIAGALLGLPADKWFSLNFDYATLLTIQLEP